MISDLLMVISQKEQAIGRIHFINLFDELIRDHPDCIIIPSEVKPTSASVTASSFSCKFHFSGTKIFPDFNIKCLLKRCQCVETLVDCMDLSILTEERITALRKVEEELKATNKPFKIEVECIFTFKVGEDFQKSSHSSSSSSSSSASSSEHNADNNISANNNYLDNTVRLISFAEGKNTPTLSANDRIKFTKGESYPAKITSVTMACLLKSFDEVSRVAGNSLSINNK